MEADGGERHGGDVAAVLHPRTHTPKWRGRHCAERFVVVPTGVQEQGEETDNRARRLFPLSK